MYYALIDLTLFYVLFCYSVNDYDYDRRRALHIAAADGKIEVLKFLIERGADVNAEDRWGNTALDDALTCKKDDSIRVLRECGAVIGKSRMDEMGNILCQAAAEGNIQHLHRLLECGVNMSVTDYDGRSPLHLAASEGHVSTVDWLIENGAEINCVDRFGNTPLSDASRSRTKQRKQVVDLLLAHNASMESVDWEIKTDPLLQGSIQRSLQFIAQRNNASYVEAWIQNLDETEFGVFEGSVYVVKDDVNKLQPFTSVPIDAPYSNTNSNMFGKVWKSQQPVYLNDITERDLPSRYQQAKQVGLRSCTIIPVSHKNKPFAILRLYSFNTEQPSEQQLQQSQQFISGLITAGVFKNGKLPIFSEIDGIPAGQIGEVYQRIVSEEVFNPNLVYHEVDWFYHMGLHRYYFERFSPQVIADHIHSFIAAKKLAATTGRSEEIMLNIESKAVDGSPSFLSMCPMDHVKMVEVEKRISNEINKIPATRAYTQEFFLSEQPILPGMYSLTYYNQLIG